MSHDSKAYPVIFCCRDTLKLREFVGFIQPWYPGILVLSDVIQSITLQSPRNPSVLCELSSSSFLK